MKIQALAAFLLVLLATSGCGDDDPATPPRGDLADAGLPDAEGPDTDTPDADEPDGDSPDAEAPIVAPPDRQPGQRAPLTAPCDAADPTRCLLPWPSDTFTEAAPQNATGLRVKVDAERLAWADDPSSLSRADGHSRISPIITAFPGTLDPASLGDGLAADGALRVIVTEPGPLLGTSAPVRYEVVPDGDHTALVAYPRVPLAPGTEHAVVVLDALRDGAGLALEADPLAREALGLTPPTTQASADLAAWHAPTRAALARAGIDPQRVLRVWSFTTRSRDNTTADLDAVRAAMLEAVDQGQVGVEIDELRLTPRAEIALIAQGRLTGLPSFVGRSGGLRRDDQGAPTPEGTREALWRVVVPAGEGDYRVVMYAHGTGGDITDPAFDALIAGEGAAKVSVQFDGWTESGLLTSASFWGRPVSGGDRTAAELVESLGMAMAIQRALGGVLGQTLAADTLQDQPNPAAGRRPSLDRAVWAGGSLGGTMGAVYAAVEPTIEAAVLNVPGAGFTHFLRFSSLYPVISLILESNIDTEIDISQAIAMAQPGFDVADGASWADAARGPLVALIQVSIGDPVLPNIGGDLVAASFGAVQLGAVLHPVAGVLPTDELETADTALTQYKAPGTGPLELHGFADRDTPAGRAAQDQIRAFITSHWAGRATIALPALCRDNTPADSCDFSSP